MRGKTEHSTTEPISRRVPGGPKLRKALKRLGKTQAWLHEGTGIPQQLISAYVNQQARPKPMSPNAVRIERATGGEVSVWDWMTSDEAAAYREAAGG